ncbi:TPA: hypothetical protein VIP67_000663 [Streptococcus pyogenes]|nr:hypothetical protein [Streptococcus pyogenes]
MEIRQVTDNIAIYSDGKRLQVIHDLGDEFILDFSVRVEMAWDIDKQAIEPFPSMEPVFKICGFCSRGGEDMHRLRWAILQFGEFERFIKDCQDDLLDWWKNPGGGQK